MTQNDQQKRTDALCDAAGTLAAQLIPERDVASVRWEQLRARAGRGSSRSRHVRRVGLVAASALLTAAVVLLICVGLRPAPITFVCSACSTGSDGHLVTAEAQRQAEVRFSDGSTVVLAPGTRTTLERLDNRGSDLHLDEGEARLAIARRSGARWAVLAGPYRVDVTGTQFRVLWGKDTGRFEVELQSGSIVLSGPRIGRIELRPGERVVANASSLDSRLPLIVRTQTGAAPPSAAPTPPEDALSGSPTANRTGEALPAARPEAPPSLAERAPGRPAPRPPSRRAHVARQSMPETPEVHTLEPPALPVPSEAPTIAAGGALCRGPAVRLSFDESTEGFEAHSWPTKALGNPRVGRSRSWCGTGSLELDADYHLRGPRNRRNQLLSQAGEVTVRLSAPVNLTQRTVRVHLYVDGPPDAVLGAHIFVLSHDQRILGGERGQLTAGRWWELRHTFGIENRTFAGNSVPADQVWQIGVEIYAAGGQRTWTGRVYVDEIEIVDSN